ncbi:MAG: preprotein translocase subunit SecE [Pseudomonadales bacterium]|nr:preprotein translocase subunit SecE [Pseudomonadales bacterium]
MNTKAGSEAESSSAIDSVKWLFALILVAAAVVGNSYFSEEPFLYRLIGVLLVSVLAAFVAAQTIKGKAFTALLKDARAEVRRVVWPTQQETLQTTGIVVLFVAFMALVLWLLDMMLGAGISELVG